MAKARSDRRKKRAFHGNRYSTASEKNESDTSASSSKLNIGNHSNVEESIKKELGGNRIMNIETLIAMISIFCCPQCLKPGLKLNEDSKEGLCSNFSVACDCGFLTGFTSIPKEEKKCTLNTLLILGLRLIGKGYTSGKKLFCTLNLPYVSKTTLRNHELKLLKAVQQTSEENMILASKEVRMLKNSDSCGVSVDGTWQRRGYMSLNGCVSAISIDTGKVLDLEVLTHYCKMCGINKKADHVCANYSGSSGSMEVVGAFRIFERSMVNRQLQYSQYYGDGDSKAFEKVKDMYGNNSVTKLECIGHVQKRVGSRLRKLKKSKKGLGGKGKLTDKFIDKLQNYYGIAIRSNVGNIDKMQSAVIAALYHSCSSKKKQMHSQCPSGKNSWCKYQRALHENKPFVDKSVGLPNSIINVIKPVYMQLCDRELLLKCLHGKTQNNNESFNNVLWSILPKETFVQRQTLLLGSCIAIILFNSGFLGLLPIFESLGSTIDSLVLKSYKVIDQERNQKSKRQSLPSAKVSRKIKKAKGKSKLIKNEAKEGLTYKYEAL